MHRCSSRAHGTQTLPADTVRSAMRIGEIPAKRPRRACAWLDGDLSTVREAEYSIGCGGGGGGGIGGGGGGRSGGGREIPGLKRNTATTRHARDKPTGGVNEGLPCGPVGGGGNRGLQPLRTRQQRAAAVRSGSRCHLQHLTRLPHYGVKLDQPVRVTPLSREARAQAVAGSGIDARHERRGAHQVRHGSAILRRLTPGPAAGEIGENPLLRPHRHRVERGGQIS
mmetsp:Transcript_5994/g.14841  ORF Transcript_5994/g.14841 Transcript_5994/m.14841 type:complete len:225 (+) Transcript_5994:2841-3515(+)